MDRTKTILVVDDEEMIRDAVSSYLGKKGFHVLSAETGKQALECFEAQAIDFVILDLMLPDLPGEEICSWIRKRSRVPVIMLTARTMEDDLLNGLRIGADDYITKPFSLKELYARIEVILRRTSESQRPLASKFQWNDGDLAIDLEAKTVKKKGAAVGLTPIEWKLLETFITYPQKVFTREELIALVFDIGFDGYERVIDTHIKNLRKKIEDEPKKSVYICTVHGVGYKFGGEEA